MDDHLLVAVSPRHSVRIAEEYLELVQKPREDDFVVRTIARREANGLPLMSAEIVIAGAATREKYPLAQSFPLHFRKTYFPGRLHGDPSREFELQNAASELIRVSPAVGYDDTSFRACLVPGTPFEQLSPFQYEPEDQPLRRAQKLPLVTAAGLWRLSLQAFDVLGALHRGGLAHGDAVLQNFIVCPSPLEIVPIDFEGSARRTELDEKEWQKRVQGDLDPLLLHAAFVLCSLGRQPEPLAEATISRLEHLVRAPERLRREIERRSALDA